MTDAEAKVYLENMVALQSSVVDGRGAALLHALQAISDREALADVLDELDPYIAALDAARRHMEGKL